MTVEITDPTDGYLPDVGTNSWNVKAYTDTMDSLNGYICDMSTFNILFPSTVTDNGNGYFTLSFNPSGANPAVTEGDSLNINVYCAHNSADSASETVIASQNGGWGSPGVSKQRRLAKKPKAKQAAPSPIQIATAAPIIYKHSQAVHDIPITINQAAGIPGLVLLLLHKFTGHTHTLRRYLHPNQGATTPTITFPKVDVGFWDVIHVMTIPIPDPAPSPAGFHDWRLIKGPKGAAAGATSLPSPKS